MWTLKSIYPEKQQLLYLLVYVYMAVVPGPFKVCQPEPEAQHINSARPHKNREIVVKLCKIKQTTLQNLHVTVFFSFSIKDKTANPM